MTVRVNKKAELSVRYVGEEKTPIMIIDNYLANIDEICSQMLQTAQFAPFDKSLYPGQRAAVAREDVVTVLKPIYPYFYKLFSIPPAQRLAPEDAYYSYVDAPPETLRLRQRLPHFDTHQPYFLAVMLYLAPGPHGGTGFFRHRETGFENITLARKDEFNQVLHNTTEKLDASHFGYIGASTDAFEMIDTVSYQQNRLVIYPGTLLHSGLIDAATDLQPDMASARLTMNLFIDFN